MKTESKQDQTQKTSKRQTKTAKAAKAGAETTPPAVKPTRKRKDDTEPVDRLPSTVDELKAGKAGLVTYLFLSGKSKDDVAAELKTAFKVSETHAAKITRRIIGRVRFFQRALSLVTAK
jgi:hypothetical protein